MFGDVRDLMLEDFTIEGQLRILTSTDPEEEFLEVLMIEFPKTYQEWQETQNPFTL